MTDRLSSIPAEKEARYRHGPPMKDRHALALRRLAGSEARIIGTAKLRTMRDMAIAALRVVTLIGAVMVPTLMPDDQKSNAKNSANPSPQPINQSIAAPTAAATSPVPVNLNFAVSGQQQPDSSMVTTIVEVNSQRSVVVREEADVVLGVAQTGDYWYRAELGENDVFWALPDGDFYFRVQQLTDCASAADACTARLDFVFNTGQNQTESRSISGVLARRVAVAGLTSCGAPITAPAPVEGLCRDGVVASYSPGGRSYVPLVCTYNDLRVSVRPAEQGTDRADKMAFEVKWCEAGRTCSESP